VEYVFPVPRETDIKTLSPQEGAAVDAEVDAWFTGAREEGEMKSIRAASRALGQGRGRKEEDGHDGPYAETKTSSAATPDRGPQHR